MASKGRGEPDRNKYAQAACDLKWAIRAVASARDAFLTQAYISRLVDVENDLIALRNEVVELAERKAGV